MLAVAIVGHLAEALTLFALMVPKDRSTSAIGLLVLAGIVGILNVVGVRAIHRRSILSVWLLLGLLPAGIGTYFAFVH